MSRAELIRLCRAKVLTTEGTGVARTLIGGGGEGGGGGCLFIYSCSAQLVSFEIKFKFINLKRN